MKDSETIIILESILNSMLLCNHVKIKKGTPHQNGYHKGHEDRKKIDIGFVEWKIEELKKK